MRKFMITVNGASYEVDVEEIGGAPTAAPVRPAAPVAAPVAPAAPVAAPVAPAAPAPAAPAAPAAPVAGEDDERAHAWQHSGCEGQGWRQCDQGPDVLVVLEAMKMENEIPALPCDGTVTAGCWSPRARR